jgi:hypothetical protein
MNQNSSRQFSLQEQINDSEISLMDILIFLKRSYKLIVLIGLLGVAASFGYLLIAPKQYQASAQIQIMKFAYGYTDSLSKRNIENPALIIMRISSTARFMTEIAKSCGLESAEDMKAFMSKSVKWTIPKGLEDVVDLKIISESPEVSIACVQAFFDLIKTTEAQILNQLIKEINTKLAGDREQLAKLKDLLVKIDKFNFTTGAHTILLNDISILSHKINALDDQVVLNTNRTSSLIGPIYADNDPVAPKKYFILLVGLFGGLFLGLLIVFGRQHLLNLKAKLES